MKRFLYMFCMYCLQLSGDSARRDPIIILTLGVQVLLGCCVFKIKAVARIMHKSMKDENNVYSARVDDIQWNVATCHDNLPLVEIPICAVTCS